MGIRGMQGTASHLEYIAPKGRKYRKDCIYYDKNICVCKTSQSYLMKCVGRFCCGKYEDSVEKKKQLEKEKEELFAYCKDIAKDEEEKKKKYKYLEKTSKKKKKTQIKLKSKDAINLDSNKHYLLGKTIKLRSLKIQEDITIKIVKPNEESTFNRRYSLDSSFARALSGKAVGDVIRVNVVNGYLAYKILSID